jgi:hypothetical protein
MYTYIYIYTEREREERRERGRERERDFTNGGAGNKKTEMAFFKCHMYADTLVYRILGYSLFLVKCKSVPWVCRCPFG